MKSLGYAITSPGLGHVSRYAIENIESAAAAAGLPGHLTPLRHKVPRKIAHYFSLLGGVRAIRRSGRRAVLVPMMGLMERSLFPWTYGVEVVPIIFDCVPHQFEAWRRVFARNKVTLAFFSASAAAAHFERELGPGAAVWLPEAIDIGQYAAGVAWTDRKTDCLELGRRYDKYHQRIAPSLQNSSLGHLFEPEKGQLVFRGKQEFLAGLGDARISVCFPQSMTHPERFGAVETLTQRYLESMASGCLVLGQAPQELIQLFGYDPVIPVDWNDPVAQIRALIQRPEGHAPLRARNLEMVRTAGSWITRMQELLSLLLERGYRVGPTSSRSLA